MLGLRLACLWGTCPFTPIRKSIVGYPALFMMILEHLQKTRDESNLAICLKNTLVFERVLPSSSPLTPARKSMAG
jgi:hypothetical protein